MAFVVPALAALGGGSAVAGGVGLASGALGAAGALAGGQAEARSASFNAKLARRQALVQRQNAQLARAQAAASAKQAARRSRLRMGAIRAAAGAAGGAGTGSVLDILGDVAEQGELERQQEIFKGELAARSETIGAQQSLAESARLKAAGSQAKTAGALRASTALLGGASQGLQLGG